jgi:hypothetical protein
MQAPAKGGVILNPGFSGVKDLACQCTADFSQRRLASHACSLFIHGHLPLKPDTQYTGEITGAVRSHKVARTTLWLPDCVFFHVST